MFNKQRLMVVGVTAFLITALGACSGGGDGGTDSTGSATATGQGSEDTTQQAPPQADTVSGLRDTVRHLSRQTVKATRPHMVRRCTSATRRVRHSASTGTGTKRKTRTWYTTERYQDCEKVRSGTETYRRVVRPERWCVSLDDVGGDTARDDVWYQVTYATYDEALGTHEHTRMRFTPTGTGC
ncbi:hypothetical protein [Streptomyces sp. NBC_00996]|uniref:hypothetical protein n=1 Tax=Streptomyces sp. NBC_00996 TaxID=2903710 RepID=UPI00386DDF04|nr:hypothetical protein OG390_29805 [Streptomyces sp. NBC_00996]